MITSPAFDSRENRFYPIARKNETIVHNGQETTLVVLHNGELGQIVFDAPTLVTDTTFTFEIRDMDGAVLYSKSGIAHNARSVVAVNPSTERVWLAGKSVLAIVTSTSQSNKTFGIGLYLR